MELFCDTHLRTSKANVTAPTATLALESSYNEAVLDEMTRRDLIDTYFCDIFPKRSKNVE
jgi:hypothetical protein